MAKQEKILTAEELAAQAQAIRPSVIYRAAKDGNSVAAWVDGRWLPVAGKVLGQPGWFSIQVEILANGKPVFDPAIYGPAPIV